MELFLEKLIPAFLQYKYALIFPLAVIEGPVVTVFTGFLASLSYINFWVAYLVVVLADITGDVIYYSMGRFGRENFIERHGHYIGITTERLQKAEGYFKNHARKTLFAAKFIQGFGTVTWIAAGVLKVPLQVFSYMALISSSVKSLIFLSLGFFFGKTYLHISPSIGYAPLVLVALYVLIYVLFVKIKIYSRILNRL